MQKTPLGAIAILVNNAGHQKPADFDKVTTAIGTTILSTNLKGPVSSAPGFPAVLAETKHGSIVQYRFGAASMAARAPRLRRVEGGSDLAGAKSSRGSGTVPRAVHVVAAGLIASEMASAAMAAQSVQKAAEGILLQAPSTTQEVADAVVFSRRRVVLHHGADESTSTAAFILMDKYSDGQNILIVSGRIEAADAARAPRRWATRSSFSDRDPEAPGFAYAICIIADVYGPPKPPPPPSATTARSANRRV